MIVDWLADCLALLDVSNLLIHEVKVLRCRVQGSDALVFPAISIQRMIVIHTNDCGCVADQGIRVRVATCSTPKLSYQMLLTTRKHSRLEVN